MGRGLDSVEGSAEFAGPNVMGGPVSIKLSQIARTLLEAQDQAAKDLLAAQERLANVLRSHNQEVATALIDAQDKAAKDLLDSQMAIAAFLSSQDIASASELQETQRDAAEALLAAQSAVAGLLSSNDAGGAQALLDIQATAAKDLLASQVAVAKVLRSNNQEVAETLLDAQDRAAKDLLASQSAVARLLNSSYMESASTLLEAQDKAARVLMASQSAVARLLASHDHEVATITAMNAELEDRVLNRTVELLNANTRLVAATLAKSDFLASVSHELRTPLNSIIGFSSLLMAGMVGELDPEQNKQIGMIHSAGQHLLALVNEVLDLSAIEGGHVRITRAPLEVAVAVLEIVESLQPLADARGLGLSFETADDVTKMVTDKRRLEQILINLVGNAIKFTDSGSVRVEVRADGQDVVFAVIDTGRGIPAKELKRIFEEFYRVEYVDGVEPEGTGLGLTVSRRLVELLGGTLSAQSEPGEGTTFTVRLPADDQAPVQASGAPKS